MANELGMSFYGQFVNTLDFCKVEWLRGGVEANLNEYKKNDLVNLLRRHPNWNEEIKSVVLTVKETKPCAAPAEMGMLMDRLAYTSNHSEEWVEIYNWHKMNTRFLTPDHEIRFRAWSDKYNLGLKPKAGQKMSRFIRQALLAMGEDLEHNLKLKTAYEKLADALSEYEIEHPLIISANPCDFLTMSYGTNWASCHIINPDIARGGDTYSGCYKAGTLSYANDESTLILYTVDKLPDDLHNLPTIPRLTRQLFMVNVDNGIIMQSRLYPYTDNLNLIDNYRAVMQDVLATCYGKSNLWSLRRDCFDTDVFTTCCGSLHYRDYEYANQYHISTSTLRDIEQVGTVSVIGNEGYYLDTNDEIEIEDADQVIHEFVCAHCGSTIAWDDATEIDGAYYCPECVRECEDCGELCVADDMTDVGGDYVYHWVCRDCLENHYCVCNHCDEYVYEDDVITTRDGEAYCQDCANEHLVYCEDCEEYVQLDDATELENGNWICDHCAHEREVA